VWVDAIAVQQQASFERLQAQAALGLAKPSYGSGSLLFHAGTRAAYLGHSRLFEGQSGKPAHLGRVVRGGSFGSLPKQREPEAWHIDWGHGTWLASPSEGSSDGLDPSMQS
jgi:hypothetical protein